MTSDQHQQVVEVHHGLKGLMLLMDEHSDLSVVKAGYLYHLMDPMVQKLETLLIEDGGYKEGQL